MVCDLPADDLAGIGVQDERRIHPPVGGGNVGDVGDPQHIRGSHGEVPFHQIDGALAGVGAAG